MAPEGYIYMTAIQSLGGEPIATRRLDPDFWPLEQWAEFDQTLLNGRSDNDVGSAQTVEPIWSATENAPYISGVRSRSAARADACTEFSLSVFSDAVARVADELVDAGTLRPGQQFTYRVYALADERPRPASNSPIEIATIAAAPVVCEAELEPLRLAARRISSHSAQAAALPVFVQQQVLDEATAAASRVGDLETGGILLGRLCRDRGGELFVCVTAQIPAEHAEATRESLRFTPRTWASADAALALRGRGEQILGWHHSHPEFCANCPPERRAACPFSRPTFSAADRALHREVFPKPWSVALLLSFLGGDRPSYDVFAWNRGRIQPIEFFSLPADQGTGVLT